jgi:hypothetical protein
MHTYYVVEYRHDHCLPFRFLSLPPDSLCINQFHHVACWLQDEEELQLLPKPKKQKQASGQASKPKKGMDSEADGDAEDTIAEFVLSDDDSGNSSGMDEDGGGGPDTGKSPASHHKQGEKQRKLHALTAKGGQRGTGMGNRRPAGVQKHQVHSGKTTKKHRKGKGGASKRQ